MENTGATYQISNLFYMAYIKYVRRMVFVTIAYFINCKDKTNILCFTEVWTTSKIVINPLYPQMFKFDRIKKTHCIETGVVREALVLSDLRDNELDKNIFQGKMQYLWKEELEAHLWQLPRNALFFFKSWVPRYLKPETLHCCPCGMAVKRGRATTCIIYGIGIYFIQWIHEIKRFCTLVGWNRDTAPTRCKIQGRVRRDLGWVYLEVRAYKAKQPGTSIQLHVDFVLSPKTNWLWRLYCLTCVWQHICHMEMCWSYGTLYLPNKKKPLVFQKVLRLSLKFWPLKGNFSWPT